MTKGTSCSLSLLAPMLAWGRSKFCIRLSKNVTWEILDRCPLANFLEDMKLTIATSVSPTTKCGSFWPKSSTSLILFLMPHFVIGQGRLTGRTTSCLGSGRSLLCLSSSSKYLEMPDFWKRDIWERITTYKHLI